MQPARMDRSIAAHQEMVDALGGNSSKRFRDLVVDHINAAATDLRGLR
jgi:DNA-binding GntR family transcriptional regulator